jgi:hypothetical protein
VVSARDEGLDEARGIRTTGGGGLGSDGVRSTDGGWPGGRGRGRRFARLAVAAPDKRGNGGRRCGFPESDGGRFDLQRATISLFLATTPHSGDIFWTSEPVFLADI